MLSARCWGVQIDGIANDIVDVLRSGGPWRLLADGVAAASSAASGKFVLGGLRGDEQAEHSNHGHVVVVVDGPLAHARYPTAYWGSLGGTPGKYETVQLGLGPCRTATVSPTPNTTFSRPAQIRSTAGMY